MPLLKIDASALNAPSDELQVERVRAGVAITAGAVAVEVASNAQDFSASGVMFEYLPVVIVDKLSPSHGQWHALIGCYGRHRRPVARSNWLLWPAPQASGTRFLREQGKGGGATGHAFDALFALKKFQHRQFVFNFQFVGVAAVVVYDSLQDPCFPFLCLFLAS